jgi:hypothetical protein
MTAVNVPGVSFPFPGKTLVIPPLSLGDLEQLLDRINNVMSGSMDKDSIATVIDATHAALRRNIRTWTVWKWRAFSTCRTCVARWMPS